MVLAALRRAGVVLQRVPRGRAWVPAALWMALITLLSSAPGRRGGGTPALAFLSNLGHAPLFGLLALWLCLLLPRAGGWPRLDGRGIALVLAGVALFGVMDELHQSTVRGRDLSLLDVLTDVAGAAGVLWVARHAGRHSADEGSVLRRLAGAAALCLVAAALATWLPLAIPGVGWM